MIENHPVRRRLIHVTKFRKEKQVARQRGVMTTWSTTTDAVAHWPWVRACGYLPSVVLVAFVLFAVPVAAGEPGDFHELSPQERSAWLDQLGKVLGETTSVGKEPTPALQPPGPWQPFHGDETFHGNATWRID